MTLWQSLILGIVQGLTEFLPVSSSGHLALLQILFGIEENNVLFAACLHLGTVAAVIAVYWQHIWYLLKHIFSKEVGLYILAAIPVAVVGFCLDDIISGLFSSPFVICIALAVTGVLMYVVDRMQGYKKQEQMTWKNALTIGLCQSVAIIPGLSRSGSTIFGALACGMERPAAAQFSFILSVPVVLGSGLYELLKVFKAGGAAGFTWTIIPGVLASAVVGYLAIKFFIKLLNRGTTRYFSYYCWALALVGLIALLIL